MIGFHCSKCGAIVPVINQIKHYNKDPDETSKSRKVNLCEGCYKEFKESNLDIIEFMNLSENAEYNFKVGDEVITSTGEVGVIKDICDCEYCKERGFCEPQVETKIGNRTIYITDNDKRVNFRSFYKIGDYIFGNLDEDCLLDDIKRTQEEINRLKNNLDTLKEQQKVIRRLGFQQNDSSPVDYESTQTVTEGSIERFCDIKTLEYTTYVKDKLTITDQEYISRSEAFNKLNTIRMQAEDGKERSVCTRMVAALLEIPVSDVKATRDMVEMQHGYITEHKGQEDDYYCECSVCKTHEISLEDKYCPECGAKMDGKVRKND